MKIITPTIILSILYSICSAQVPDLTNWKIDTIPTLEETYTGTHPQKDWTFALKGSKWEIVQNSNKREKGDSFPFSPDFIQKNLKEIKGNRFVKKTDDGYLVGLNNGEFRGGLYFVKPNGLDYYNIPGHLTIRHIFEYQTKYFAIEGLSHLGLQRGHIIEIFKADSVWKFKPLTTLIETPSVITDYKDEKIIITGRYILKFGKDLKVAQVLKVPIYLGMLYPSSILVDNSDLYIAMPKGVLKIKTFDTQPKYEWYVPCIK